MAGQLLPVPEWTPRKQPVARNEPADEENARENGQSDDRPVRSGRELRRQRPRGARLPGTEVDEGLEEQRGEKPEEKPAPVAPQRGSERDVPPPQPCEEVDDDGEAGQERREEDEHDGPAADGARAEVDIGARCPPRARPPSSREPSSAWLDRPMPVRRLALSRCMVSPNGRRRAIAGRREGDRCDVAADERRLLVQAQRKGEVEELRESARASSRGAGLLRELARRRCERARGQRTAGRRRRKRGVGGRSRRSSPGRRPRRRDPCRASALRNTPLRGLRTPLRPWTGTGSCDSARAAAAGPGASRTSAPARGALRFRSRCRSRLGSRRCCRGVRARR